MGIVHVEPGRCAFLNLYTDCSRTRSAAPTANVVYNHGDDESLEKEKSDGIGIALRGDAMTEGKEIDADWNVAFAMVNDELDDDSDGDDDDDDEEKEKRERDGEDWVRAQARQVQILTAKVASFLN